LFFLGLKTAVLTTVSVIVDSEIITWKELSL